jgi:tetratricopeptide (TPR) repeat protein
MSLALLEYRKGDYSKATEWCQKSLTDPRLNAPGVATADVILAMACWQLNHKAQAISQWSTGEEIIEGKFRKGLTIGSGSVGYWSDWVIAKALSAECQALFASADVSAAAAARLTPSPDTSSTFRGEGEWHALRGEWRLAADCYASALKLDQYDGWRNATDDQLSCAVSLLEAGDTAGYERFREEEIARCNPPDPVWIAQFKLKASLLLPADEKTLASLTPIADVAAGPFTGTWNPGLLDLYDGWRCVSMALFEYRRHNFAKAIDWSRRCLGCAVNISSRTATARLILAMSLHQLGQDDEAGSELLQAQNTINARFSSPMDHGSADHGMWWDWVLGRQLLREATAVLAAAPQTAPATH